MAQCITCGTELHPERAEKYDYCMARECQEKNAKGLTMVAVGMNKAADELVILDERTREDLANGRYRDQRRGFFGPLAPAAPAPSQAAPAPSQAAPAPSQAAPAPSQAVPAPGRAAPAPGPADPQSPAPPARAARRSRLQPTRPTPAGPARQPWTGSQERLALLYNEQGLRPDEIAGKLGVSTYLATQIILAARSRRRA
jgi:hypothetical protein